MSPKGNNNQLKASNVASANKKQSFIRWQERTMKQLGYVNDLLIALSIGLIAFQTQLVIGQESFNILNKVIISLSLLLILLSILLGCYVAWNRLLSFRLTAQIARKRETNQRARIDELRDEVKIKDERTWWYLHAQAVSFGVGALLLVIFTITHLIE
jgi:amino acid permease